MVNLKFLQIVVKSAWQGTKVQAKGHEVYFLYFEIYFLLLMKIKRLGRFIFLELPDYQIFSILIESLSNSKDKSLQCPVIIWFQFNSIK